MNMLILGFLFFFLSFNTLMSQENDVTHQDLLWGRYNLKFQVSEKWTPYFDIEERVYSSSLRQHHLLPSLGINYKLNENFSFTAAILYFELTLPQDPNANSIERSRELWPLLAINFKHDVSQKFSFLSRLKSESRYKQRADNAYTFRNIRLRMRLGLVYKITPKLKTIVKQEVLINIRNEEIRNVFDQNRFSAGINYKIDDRFAVEAGYLNWFQQRPNTRSFVNRNIVYLTVLHNVKLH